MFLYFLTDVANLRKQKRQLSDELDTAVEALEATPQWLNVQAIKAAKQVVETHLTIAEAAAREQIASNYDGTKSGNGWGIRVLKRLEYNLDAATEWARQNLPTAMVLDKKVFEKVAPSLPNAPVTVFDLVTATLDSDLSKFEDEE